MRLGSCVGGPGFLTALKGGGPTSSHAPNVGGSLPCARPGAPTGGSPFLYFNYTKLGNQQYQISGTTKSSSGQVLGGCTVHLYTTTDDVLRATTTSDASTGVYSFFVPSNGWNYYVVAYLAGSPDLAGTTVGTLRGA